MIQKVVSHSFLVFTKVGLYPHSEMQMSMANLELPYIHVQDHFSFTFHHSYISAGTVILFTMQCTLTPSKDSNDMLDIFG